MVKTKTEARREAILAAAKAVFEEVGFEQATMAEVTARVGGSKATLYRYFDSKDALFAELVARSALEHGGQLAGLFPQHCAAAGTTLPPQAMEALALLDPDKDVRVTLQCFGEHVIKTFFTPQKLAAKRMVIAAAGNNPELGRLFYENGPGRGMQLMERYFDAVIKAGKLRPAEPRLAAMHFRALLDAEWDEAGLLNVPLDLGDEHVAASVAHTVETYMRAYGPA